MPDLLAVALLLVVVGCVVLPPLRHAAAHDHGADRLRSAALRHRVALEALRDVETDRRSGSLDAATHAEQRLAAEERAALTRAELDRARVSGAAPTPPADPRSRRAALLVALGVAAALLLGTTLPPPLGLANATVVDRQLAAGRVQEAARLDRIAVLLERLRGDPRDVQTLSELADAYLAGATREDLVGAATALQLLIGLRPDDADAHRRIISAYLRAGDYRDAAAALASFERLDPDPADLAFFRGLLALRGGRDAAAALVAFDRFLELAPDDPRAAMVRALRAEAQALAGE